MDTSGLEIYDSIFLLANTRVASLLPSPPRRKSNFDACVMNGVPGEGGNVLRVVFLPALHILSLIISCYAVAVLFLTFQVVTSSFNYFSILRNLF